MKFYLKLALASLCFCNNLSADFEFTIKPLDDNTKITCNGKVLKNNQSNYTDFLNYVHEKDFSIWERELSGFVDYTLKEKLFIPDRAIKTFYDYFNPVILTIKNSESKAIFIPSKFLCLTDESDVQDKFFLSGEGIKRLFPHTYCQHHNSELCKFELMSVALFCIIPLTIASIFALELLEVSRSCIIDKQVAYCFAVGAIFLTLDVFFASICSASGAVMSLYWMQVLSSLKDRKSFFKKIMQHQSGCRIEPNGTAKIVTFILQERTPLFELVIRSNDFKFRYIPVNKVAVEMRPIGVTASSSSSNPTVAASSAAISPV
ncbi:TPA: hypothetical protein DEO28_01130 [Candidatus Dependentiae bacterium]|nr:MAG: hypothetical protein UR14_C0003G0076 [candidate division TM6 bacterium GW2011_GWE2_31_21]KKP53760.1 MAG: hypothetical protein UR43_C0003G0081 [candidate division TM6 bacterium GW2011_GWF2_33_332]HBS48486.1 hypothetical protein [Candidatus Dependentiae bacterium]HBZ73101.1 hypothetical protein [Candidatus Dependentiae bacterium]